MNIKNKGTDLLVSSFGDVLNKKYDLVILPWGATEPHNLHLPYLTDCILSHSIAVDAAKIAKDHFGVNSMVMPPITLGAQNPGQRELSFCIHARYETQKAILTDIVSSLHIQGINKLVIINGHGGNCFKNMIRDMSIDYPDFLIATSEWYTVLPAKQYFDTPGDHADEVETSVMMHYYQELVNLKNAGKGKYKSFALESLREKVAWIPRNWQKVSEDTGIGDPALSTAEKGKCFANAIADKYAQLFAELSRIEETGIYEKENDK